MSELDRDGFWDIEKLVPPKKRMGRVQFDTSSVEINDSIHSASGSEYADKKASGELMLSDAAEMRRSSLNEKLLYSYRPENPFIESVSVYSQQGGYQYYADFERAMHKYLRLTVRDAERVPFFSYVPQYSQLSPQRMAWYLYWRSGCRRREYMPTDFSYILLYAFELINFDNPKYPDKMIEELCCLWRAYRNEHRQLDRYLADWVCDYCLIHRVEMPYEIISDFVGEILKYTTLRELYLGCEGDFERAYTQAVLYEPSVYSYRKSKYYTEQTRALFEEHIPTAIARVLDISGDAVPHGDSPVRIKRDVYVGALCTSTAKRTLHIEYYPLYRPSKMRTEVALAVKYAENKLRAYIGVRSRLLTNGLSDEAKERIDGYFFETLGCVSRHSLTGEKPEPEYMSYYESKNEGMEIDRALDIEKQSWLTAQLMGECFDSECEDCDTASDTAPDAKDNSGVMTDVATRTEENCMFLLDSEIGDVAFDTSDLAGALESIGDIEREFLRLLLLGDKKRAQRAVIDSGQLVGEVCERINSVSFDMISDILIECDEEGYFILPDYESEVRKWLKI